MWSTSLFTEGWLAFFITGVLFQVTRGYKCTVSRKAFKQGFHRDIETAVSIVFEAIDLPANSHCEMAMEETLPSSMYADLFQIKMLQEMGGPKVHSEHDIDVEKPEHLSTQHTIHVFSPLNIEAGHPPSTTNVTAHLSVPLHLRYHKPVSGQQQFVTAMLQPPQLYLRCHGAKLSFISETVKEIPCSNEPSRSCLWTLLPCSTIGDGTLRFEVPVGRLDHLPLVVSVTIVLVMAATAYVVWLIVTKAPTEANPHTD